MRGIACFTRAQVVAQRRRGQVTHATEEVQLVARDGEHAAVNAASHRRAGRRYIRRGARAVHFRTGTHARQQIGPLQAILRARCLDIHRRHAQVAVVFQRDADQCLQARVGVVVLPADIGSRGLVNRRGVSAGRALDRLRHRCRRTLVGRRQAAASQGQGGRAGQGAAAQRGESQLSHANHPSCSDCPWRRNGRPSRLPPGHARAGFQLHPRCAASSPSAFRCAMCP